MVTYKAPDRITELNTQNVFNDLLAIVTEENEGIEIDMIDTVYISSAALKTFLRIAKLLSSKKLPALKLKNANETINEIIDIAGFNLIVNVSK